MDDAQQYSGREQDQCEGEDSHQNQQHRDDLFKHQGILWHMRFFVGVRIVRHIYLTQSNLSVLYFALDA